MATGIITSPTTWLVGTVITPQFMQSVMDNINNPGAVTFTGLQIDGTGNTNATVSSGAIQFPGRFISKNASTPTATANSGAGTGPTISFFSGSTDVAGQISVQTGTAPATSSVIVSIKLASGASRPSGAFAMIWPASATAAALSGTSQVWVNNPGTDWELRSGSAALAGSTTYVWNYIVVDRG